MNENESAVRVATTIHGYFNYLEEKIEEGEYSYNEIPPGEFYFFAPAFLYCAMRYVANCTTIFLMPCQYFRASRHIEAIRSILCWIFRVFSFIV
jgi:hypothetical protein